MSERAGGEAVTASEASYARLRRGVLVFTALFSVFIVLAAAWGLSVLRTSALDAAERRAQGRAAILASHLERVTNGIQSRLSSIAEQSARLGGPRGSAGPWRQVLVAAASGSATIHSLSVVDREGVIRQSTFPEVIGRSMAEFASPNRTGGFRRLLSGEAGEFVAGVPIVAPDDGRVLQPYANRIANPNGATLGLVIATFDAEALRDFYRQLDGDSGGVTIAHQSGAVLLQEPRTIAFNVEEGLARAATGQSSGDGVGADGSAMLEAYRVVNESGLILTVSVSRSDALAEWRSYAWGASLILVGMLLALWLAVAIILRQLAARVSAEAALAVQQRRLAEAQRLESIGQLTGGVAHDFNNLLTVILNSADTMLTRVSDDVRPRVEAILHAAENGAALVRQLLAFSRRQALTLAPVDVNSVVAAMEDMLRRTLGAHVELGFALAPDLWRAYGDRAQIESAVLNLVINARDAMPGGGTLTIETRNVQLDAEYVADAPDVAGGDYVALAVTDTGSGMTPEVMARAMEPFFTTKEVGKGTGLGLSMVFGFAKQSKGHLKIYSEVGAGTTVRLYLPRDITGERAETPQMSASDRGGDETILVVEDETNVRDLAATALRERGYKVVEAVNGADAVERLAAEQKIHLLLTDMIMPGQMTGRDVAEHALKARPDLKLLFTSGYADVSVMRNGLVKEGARFISKPYRGAELARVVRALLDS